MNARKGANFYNVWLCDFRIFVENAKFKAGSIRCFSDHLNRSPDQLYLINSILAVDMKLCGETCCKDWDQWAH